MLTDILHNLVASTVVLILCLTTLWAISIKMRDASIIDILRLSVCICPNIVHLSSGYWGCCPSFGASGCQFILPTAIWGTEKIRGMSPCANALGWMKWSGGSGPFSAFTWVKGC